VTTRNTHQDDEERSSGQTVEEGHNGAEATAVQAMACGHERAHKVDAHTGGSGPSGRSDEATHVAQEQLATPC